MKKNLFIIFSIIFLLIGCPQNGNQNTDTNSSSDNPVVSISYKINFVANGADGQKSSITLKGGEESILYSSEFSKTGYVFTKWTTNADGSGKSYSDNSPVKDLTTDDNAEITLYAQWKLIKYYISFDKNKGTGTTSSMTLNWDETKNLPKCKTKLTGYLFEKWNTEADGSGEYYTDEQEVTNLTTVNEDTIKLYPQWKPIHYTINFNSNGGSGEMTAQTLTYDTESPLTANSFDAPAGKVFAYWSDSNDGQGNTYIDSQTVLNITTTNDDIINLYANWINEGEYAILYYDPLNAANPNPQIYTAAENIVLEDLTYDKNIFLGFYDTDDEENLGDKITGWSAGDKSGTIQLWARWEGIVQKIGVMNVPKKLEYNQGESIDLTGLSGIVTYEDGSQKIVSYSEKNKADFGIPDITNMDLGSQTVICNYKTKSFFLKISIIKSRPAKNSWETTTIESLSPQINNDFWDNANVYFVLTDRFYNGDTNNDTSYGRVKGVYNTDADAKNYYGGDIKGLTQKLDYLVDTGINAIWITAPYEQIHGWVGGSYPYHGYWTLDWTQMDANVGTAEEFRTFVDTAHSKGIRVVMDVVMNHPGYATLVDLKNLVSSGSKGVLKKQDIENANPDTYHDVYIDYDSHEWHDWWGIDWVRAGFCSHYTNGTGDLQGSCGGSLPDFITESGKGVDLSPMFTRKLADTVNYPRAGYAVTDLTNDDSEAGNYRMRDYMIKWLSDWVREFGIDGFRCDTAKHVEKEAWYQLKVACVQALRDWKTANPTKKVDDSDFWMTGEVFGHDVEKDDYFTDGGFDSLINFAFKDKIPNLLTNIKGVEAYYSKYDNRINSDNNFNMLTYISSHDTTLCYSYYAKSSINQKIVGSLLAFCPGAIQIYYGDECGRKVSSSTDTEQQTRSQMPWNEAGYNNLDYQFDSDIHAHWSKVLNFRKKHVAVGAGTHAKIADTPYTFSRVKGSDKVIVVLGASGSVEVDVSAIGATKVKDAYTGTVVNVTNGKATFTADSNGVILIEAAE